MEQAIDIPTGVDSAPFLANPFLYYYEEEYMSSLTLSNNVKGRYFPSIKCFIDHLRALDNDGEFAGLFMIYIKRNLNF